MMNDAKLLFWCIAVAAGLALKTWGCPAPETARDVLNVEGYTDVETEAWRGWSCGKGDTFATGFKAKGPTGKPIAGAVCCGILKACTVRVEAR